MSATSQVQEYDPYVLSEATIKEPPTRWLDRIRYLGPGIILSASIVGSGELIATTTLGARAGFVTLWGSEPFAYCTALCRTRPVGSTFRPGLDRLSCYTFRLFPSYRHASRPGRERQGTSSPPARQMVLRVVSWSTLLLFWVYVRVILDHLVLKRCDFGNRSTKSEKTVQGGGEPFF